MYCRWGPAINCLCLSKARSWIFNVLYRSIIVFSELRWDMIVHFVDISEIVDLTFFS
jgi:hypothetical protein